MFIWQLNHVKECVKGAVLLFSALYFFSPCSLLAAEPESTIQALRSVKIITTDDSGEQIRFPSSISYDRDGDEIYINSPQKNKLVIFTPDYYPYLSIGRGRGLNSINRTFINKGLLYVCLGASTVDPRPQIAIFDMAFLAVKQLFFDDLEGFSPYDLVVGGNGNLYVVGTNGAGVMVLDSDGKFLRRLEPKDDVLGVMEKAVITAIEIDAQGHIYLLSEQMGRVYVYGTNERFLYKFGKKGGDPGTLSRPRGIAVDNIRRQVYIVDYQRHTMSIYTQAGEYLFEIGGKGGGRGWFYYPSDLIVDGRGRVVVADTFNHRLQVFEFIGNKGFGQQTDGQLAAAVQTMEQVKDVVRVGSIELQLPVAESLGDYLILVAMWRELKNAEELQLQLSRKGYPVLVQQIELGRSGTWYQVLIGPYLEPLDAYAVLQQLQTDEQLPAILKTRGPAFDLEILESEEETPDPDNAEVIQEPVVEEEVLPVDQLNAIERFEETEEKNPFLIEGQ